MNKQAEAEDPMVTKWRSDVYERQRDLDPRMKRDWFEVAFDWALSLGDKGLL